MPERIPPMEQEQSNETYSVAYAGRLEDLGLGNPDGIPSRLAEASHEDLVDYAEQLIRQLEVPETTTSFSCIDGREILRTIRGEPANLRLRRVGGSASNYGVALNGGINAQDAAHADTLSGTERSAHTAGCGGANGEVSDNVSIANNPVIMDAVKVVMELSGMSDYTGVSYDRNRALQVRKNAVNTAAIESSEKWNGQTYVDEVTKDHPENVDELDHDPNDTQYHGHDEVALVVILGKKTLRHGNFVWNIEASKQAIEGFKKHGGDPTQLWIAEIAKHLAVANRLPSTKTPLIVLAAN